VIILLSTYQPAGTSIEPTMLKKKGESIEEAAALAHEEAAALAHEEAAALAHIRRRKSFRRAEE
jgi:hypothetical protein